MWVGRAVLPCGFWPGKEQRVYSVTIGIDCTLQRPEPPQDQLFQMLIGSFRHRVFALGRLSRRVTASACFWATLLRKRAKMAAVALVYFAISV